MQEVTGRRPNRIGLGANVFTTLKNHPGILERVKYGGSTANPASVTLNVLSQLFSTERVVVMQSIMNKADMGGEADMGFIGDPNAILLATQQTARLSTSPPPDTSSHGICSEMGSFFRF